MKNLLSSIREKGETVDQIIHFVDGSKKTFRGILSDSIEQSEFTRFDLKDGRRVYVNTKNVNCFEVFEDYEKNINRSVRHDQGEFRRGENKAFYGAN